MSAILVIGLAAVALSILYPTLRRNISAIVFLASMAVVIGSAIWGWRHWTDHKKTAFEVLGPIFLTCFAAVTVWLLLRFNQCVQDNFRYFIVLASLTWTVVYVFLFIIVPQFEEHQGLRGGGPYWLGVTLIFSVIMTVILFSIYFDMTFLDRNFKKIQTAPDAQKLICRMLEGTKPLYIEEVLAVFGSKATIFSDIVYQYHFLIFILSFVAVDLVFVIYSPKPLAARKFVRLIILVDIPMVTAALGTVGAKQFMLDNAFEETFEAGAIAFQLVSGSIAAYLLDNLQRVIWCFRQCREATLRCIR